MVEKIVALTISLVSFIALPPSVYAQPVPVRPESPAATVKRAESLIAMRLLRDAYPVPLYLVEVDGVDYTIVLTDAGSEMVRRSGRSHLLGVPGRIGIRVDVTSMDASEVSCSIYDADGERIAWDGNGMIAQCWVQ